MKTITKSDCYFHAWRIVVFELWPLFLGNRNPEDIIFEESSLPRSRTLVSRNWFLVIFKNWLLLGNGHFSKFVMTQKSLIYIYIYRFYFWEIVHFLEIVKTFLEYLQAVDGGNGENVTCFAWSSGVHGDGKMVPCEKY